MDDMRPRKMKRVACPHCGREIAVMANGQIRRHQTGHGIPCSGRLDRLVPAGERRVLASMAASRSD